jgi:hypothetical protein
MTKPQRSERLQRVIVESMPRYFAVTLFQHIRITLRIGGGLSLQSYSSIARTLLTLFSNSWGPKGLVT